ncbi:MAG: hypothetical protein Q8S48_17595 [Methylococcaceae bacterium]|nr:hypothetical protein [Methylococcaceae bacterium]
MLQSILIFCFIDQLGSLFQVLAQLLRHRINRLLLSLEQRLHHGIRQHCRITWLGENGGSAECAQGQNDEHEE